VPCVMLSSRLSGEASIHGGGVGGFRLVEAKYPALLFKQQLDAFVQKIFPMMRDNVKKSITPLLVSLHRGLVMPWKTHRHTSPHLSILTEGGVLRRSMECLLLLLLLRQLLGFMLLE